MAEANKSRELKIAVAAFISITVILAIACFFPYAAYTQAEARRFAAEAEARRVAAEARGRPPATAPSNSPR
jgi:hypothetical protein